jgi:hypothetical protein
MISALYPRAATRRPPFLAPRVRCCVAIQRNGIRNHPLAVDRLRKEGLGSNDIALGAEPEIDCLSRSINGTVKIGPFSTNLYVSSTRHERPADIANRFQRLTNSGVKRLIQRMIVVCDSDRPRSTITSTRSRRLSLQTDRGRQLSAALLKYQWRSISPFGMVWGPIHSSRR